MKYLMILMLSFLTVIIYSEDFPIMLNLKSDIKIPDDFRDGVEEALTQMNYSLVDEKAQKEALKENAKARNSECYDDECLVDTGKMLAARALISVTVDKKNDKLYKFKGKYIDFETGTTTKSKVMYYEAKLDDYKALSKFGKEFSKSLLGGKVKSQPAVETQGIASPQGIESPQEKNKKSAKIETPKKNPSKASVAKPKKDYAGSDFQKNKKSKEDSKEKSENLSLTSERYNGNWDITFALQGGSREYDTSYDIIFKNGDRKSEKDDDGISKGVGLSIGINYRFKPWLGFYSNLNFLSVNGEIGGGNKHITNQNGEPIEVPVDPSEYNVITTWLSFGVQFSLGDTMGSGLVYYSKLGIAFGRDQYIYKGSDSPSEKEIGKELQNGDDISTAGIELEFGLNLSITNNNTLDIYFLMYYGNQFSGGREETRQDDKIEISDDYGSHTFNALLGIRYNLFTF